jgi:hypothetical protein
LRLEAGIELSPGFNDLLEQPIAAVLDMAHVGGGLAPGQVAVEVSCELKLFFPQLSASEGEAANRLDLKTTLLQSQLK